MKVQDRIEEIIIDSDLYQTFIGEHADYSFMEKKLATAILKECIHVSELPKEKELNYEDIYKRRLYKMYRFKNETR